MQRKSLVSSLAVVLALVCVLLGNVRGQAHTAIPATSVDCQSSGPCLSFGYWKGNVNGGQVLATVSDPGFFGSSDGYFERYMRLGSGSPRLFLGMSKNQTSGHGDFCTTTTSLQYILYTWDSSGVLKDHKCWAVPSADKNHDSTFTATAHDSACSNAFGIAIQEQGFNNITYCTTNGVNTYDRQEAHEVIDDSAVQGHQVWGSEWTGWCYINNVYTCTYQTTAFSITHSDPPEMYWAVLPSPGGTGGDLNSCDYYPDSTGTCTLGS